MGDQRAALDRRVVVEMVRRVEVRKADAARTGEMVRREVVARRVAAVLGADRRGDRMEADKTEESGHDPH